MAGSDYAYLFYWLLPDDDITHPWRDDTGTDSDQDLDQRQAFYSLKQVSAISVAKYHEDQIVYKAENTMKTKLYLFSL